jgi:ATP-binding cassette, subfamily A (ABC1), member 3
VLVAFLYFFPDFALCQTLLAFTDQKRLSNHQLMQYFLSMMVTMLILVIILLYFCENTYVRDRCSLFWHHLKAAVNGMPCKKLANIIDGIEVDKQMEPTSFSGGDDVEKERNLVKTLMDNLNQENHSVIVHELEKKYFDFPAVRGLNFAVQEGNCFGLLGTNGAGKTTTFNMMTLYETITNGSIKMNNVSCRNNRLQYKSQFGYCPQVDALNPLMTTYEILKYSAWIRGVPRHLLPNIVEYWLKRVDISDFRERQVQYLPSIAKRKLSMAVAMVGSPPIIFLDEPTSGLDSESQRVVWNCIKEYQYKNKTIVFTSHSMVECENLCDRLAIMDQGQINGIDDMQQLKKKFGNGFKLTIMLKRVNDENREELKNLKIVIAEKIACSLESEHGVSCFQLQLDSYQNQLKNESRHKSIFIPGLFHVNLTN